MVGPVGERLPLNLRARVSQTFTVLIHPLLLLEPAQTQVSSDALLTLKRH